MPISAEHCGSGIYAVPTKPREPLTVQEVDELLSPVRCRSVADEIKKRYFTGFNQERIGIAQKLRERVGRLLQRWTT